MRIVDLSITMENGVPSDPPFQMLEIEYMDHEQGAEMMVGVFPGLRTEALPGGKGWATEKLTLSTHNGTHIDAPWHYHPTTNGGEPAPGIDEVPLDWFFRPGVKLDFRDYEDGYVVQPADIQRQLDEIGYALQPFDIVLMNTAAGSAYGRSDYIDRGCGFGRDSTLFLTDLGIRVVGTDGWSWDAPFSYTARRYADTGDASLIWEGHKAGAHAAYCQIEKLHNLDQLPPTGFTVACFPAKLKHTSAGWTRAVAIFEEES